MASNNRRYIYAFSLKEEDKPMSDLKFGKSSKSRAKKSVKKSRRVKKSVNKSRRVKSRRTIAKKSRRTKSRRSGKSAKKSRAKSKTHRGEHHEFRRLVLA